MNRQRLNCLGASRARIARRAFGMHASSVDVEVPLGTVGQLYETIVKRQGLGLHLRGGKIDLAWFHTLHTRWRQVCR